MHDETLIQLRHNHNFAVINKKGERRTRLVLVLTLLTMILEIAAGMVFGSMALLADGLAHGHARCRLYDYLIRLPLFPPSR